MPIEISLCGLTSRLEHLLKIVINSSNPQKFHAAAADKSVNPQIVIIDADSQPSLDAHQDYRSRHPAAICLTISDHPSADKATYRIPRKSLFIKISSVLNEIAERELTGNGLTRNRAFSTIQPPPATPPLACRTRTRAYGRYQA